MRSLLKPTVWTILAAALVAGILWAATDREIYLTTTPHSMAAHIWVRKAYSIVAFAIVGAIIVRWWPSGGRILRVLRTGAIVAFYSALIEIAQKAHGSTESWRWNLFDIGCGLLGGLVGALFYRHPTDH